MDDDNTYSVKLFDEVFLQLAELWKFIYKLVADQASKKSWHMACRTGWGT